MKKALNFLAVVAIALAAVAFEARAQDAPSAPGTRVDGRVVTTDGKPLDGALVEIQVARSKGLPPPSRKATSGADGTFVVDGLAPGEYAVTSVKLDSYRMARGESERFMVTAGEAHHELLIKMTPLGTVTGDVLDSHGAPVKSARIQLLRSTYRSSNSIDSSRAHRLRVAGDGETKDGEFEIKNVEPGRYYIMALNPIRAEAADKLLPTFYPSGHDIGEAQAVEVGLEPVKGLQIRMRQGPTYKVRLTLEGVPPEYLVMPKTDVGRIGLEVLLLAREESLRTVGFNGSRKETIFEFKSVPAGDYIALLQYNPEKASGHTSRVDIHVDGDVDKRVTYDAGVEVTGHVRRADGLPLDAPVPGISGIYQVPAGPGSGFQLVPVDSLGPVMIPSWAPKPTAIPVNPDGTFRGNVIPGRYTVAVSGLLKGATHLASVHVGGVDMTGKAFDIQSGADLDVVVSREFAQMSITWPAIEHATTTFLAMWAATPNDYVRADVIRAPRPGERVNSYIFDPGEVFVAVFDSVPDESFLQAPEVMARFNALATRVKLGVGPQTIAPKSISREVAQKVFDEFR